MMRGLSDQGINFCGLCEDEINTLRTVNFWHLINDLHVVCTGPPPPHSTSSKNHTQTHPPTPMHTHLK